MCFNQIKAMALLCLFSFSIISCSEESSELIVDDSNITSEDIQLTNRRSNQDGQNNGNDRQGERNQGQRPGSDNPSGPDRPGGDQNQDILVASLDNNITEMWMDLFLEIERFADGMRPNASARALAYISLAAYETALPGMPDFQSNEGRISGFRLDGNVNTESIDWEAALNASYAYAFRHFIINAPDNQMRKIGNLERAVEDKLSEELSPRIIQNSKEWGKSITEQIISYSKNDREAEQQIRAPQPLSYEPPAGDGYWTYSAEQERALFPYWESVRTFVVSTNETTSLDPIPYSDNPGSAYYQEMEEVYKMNNTAREEDNDDLWIAEFWSDDVVGTTFGPPSRQFSIANQLINQYALNLEETLHMYVKLGFALNDAAVSTWKYKYEHMVMRPNVFIHEFIDPSFQTNLYRLVPWPNPTFPGYPSGHSCFASAGAGVFIDFFGDATNFTDRSHEGRTEFRGTPRHFNSFSQMAEENAFSRIPLGVHIRMDCSEGLRLGYEISDGINQYQLKRSGA